MFTSAIERTIDEQMSTWSVPGLAIGVLQGGEVETRGYGTASIATRQAVSPDMLFQIGSISKIFTTTLVMTLVDEGLVDLDVPVITYVPDLPLADKTARETITLRNLVTHMSGFYGDRFDDHGYGEDALTRAVAAFADLPQQTAPGELWTYCNAGFDLAGRAVERVLGKPFEQAMRDRILAPLKMERSTYFAQEAIRHAVAVGHVPADGADSTELKVADPWPIPRRSNPAGGVSANVAELLRFAQMHLNDGELDGARVLSETSARAMRTKQTDAAPGTVWGLGWSMHTIGDTLIVEHGGATNGFTARLTTIPAKNVALAILTNGDRGGAAHGKISAEILEKHLGLAAEEPKEITLEADALAAFAGQYKHSLAELTLTVEDGGFKVDRIGINPFSKERTEREPFRLVPTGDRVFVGRGSDFDGAIADFILNADGSVRFLRIGGRLTYPAAG